MQVNINRTSPTQTPYFTHNGIFCRFGIRPTQTEKWQMKCSHQSKCNMLMSLTITILAGILCNSAYTLQMISNLIGLTTILDNTILSLFSEGGVRLCKLCQTTNHRECLYHTGMTVNKQEMYVHASYTHWRLTNQRCHHFLLRITQETVEINGRTLHLLQHACARTLSHMEL